MAQTLQGAYLIAAKKLNVSIDEYLIKIVTEKWCTKGKHWMPRNKFVKDSSRGDGLSAKCSQCTRSANPWQSSKGRTSYFKGKKHTEEAKAEMSKKRKGKQFRLGIKHTTETRIKISVKSRLTAKRGAESPHYKDGKFAERMGVRYSAEYKQWRFDVFSRDNFTCQECGDNKGGNLNAHHIKPFAEFPELRLDINNGITLCETCHDKKHFKSDSIRNRAKRK